MKVSPVEVGFDARLEAISILEKVDKRQAYAARLLDDRQRYRDWPPEKLAFLRQLVKGCLQWKSGIDSLLDELVKGGTTRLDPQLLAHLRLASYELLFLDSIPLQVTVNETVEAVKKFGHKGMASLANAVLRKVAGKRAGFHASRNEASTPEDIAASFSHPLWIVKKWFSVLGAEETRALCSINNQRWPLCLRVNTLKADCAEARRVLETDGLTLEAAQWYGDCLLVRRMPAGCRLTNLRAFQEGLVQTQDESSALTSLLLNPQAGETILDLCSAPGGKAVHMAALMKNQGRIIALDPFANRLKLVHDNCQRLGASCVEIFRGDGRDFIPDVAPDAILLDAPCSGLGALGRRSDLRWNKSEEDIPGLVRLQGELLNHAAQILKPGGRLIYSTCTSNPDENEAVVKAFLKQHPEFQLAKPAETFPAALIDSEGFYRTWPQRHQTGGAFGAILERGHP